MLPTRGAITTPKKAQLNYDAMTMAPKAKVTQRCVSIFDRLQLKRDKELNLVAMACAFILACRAFEVEPQAVATLANNVMYDPLRYEGIGQNFAAMEQHLREDY